MALAGGGFTRVSFGMQSAVPHVLKVLERTHEPARVPRVVDWHGGRASAPPWTSSTGRQGSPWRTGNAPWTR